MSDIIKLQNNTNVLSSDERKKVIDSLLDIRLSLSIKKITKKTISKAELKNIIDDAKQKTESNTVKDEIDKVFDEYFVSKKEERTESNENKSLSIEEMENIVNSKINFKEEGNAITGNSLVKRDNHFNSSSSADKAA